MGHIMDIVNAYVNDLVPMIDIAKELGCSRQTVWKNLKKLGIDTSKGQRVKRECAWCGLVVERVKSMVRGRKRVFCNGDCYWNWMDAGGNYSPNRHGQRIGRSVVSQYFRLDDGMVVHHEDGDCLNNAPVNLKVFQDHGDHMRYHFQKRGGERITVEVLWEGSVVTPLWPDLKGY